MPKNTRGGNGGLGRGRGTFGSDGGNDRGGCPPYQRSGWRRGAGAAGHNFYEGSGRTNDPSFRVGGAGGQGFHAAGGHGSYGREQGYEGYSHYDDSQQWHQQGYGEDDYGYQGYGQEDHSYRGHGNEDMTKQTQSGRHEVAVVPRMSGGVQDGDFRMYNSTNERGKQENVVGLAHSSAHKDIYGAYVDGSDEAMVSLNQKLPPGPKSLLVACHGAAKKGLPRVQGVRATIDIGLLAIPRSSPASRDTSRQGRGRSQTVARSEIAMVAGQRRRPEAIFAREPESSATSGQVNTDSRGGAQVSATDVDVKAVPIKMEPSEDVILGSIRRELSEGVRMEFIKEEVADAPSVTERARR